MKITNPTDTNISVQLEGTLYELDAQGSINNVPENAVNLWKKLQPFLIVSEDDKKKEAEVKPAVQEPVIVETVTEPVVQEEAIAEIVKAAEVKTETKTAPVKKNKTAAKKK